MNAADRALLDEVPVPVADGESGRACVVRDAAGWRSAWLLGTAKEPFGPVYPFGHDGSHSAVGCAEGC